MCTKTLDLFKVIFLHTFTRHSTLTNTNFTMRTQPKILQKQISNNYLNYQKYYASYQMKHRTFLTCSNTNLPKFKTASKKENRSLQELT